MIVIWLKSWVQVLESLQAWPKRPSQRFKLLLEVPPVAYARRVDRLTDLFGTCGAH
jgi:hypothetical protein